MVLPNAAGPVPGLPNAQLQPGMVGTPNLAPRTPGYIPPHTPTPGMTSSSVGYRPGMEGINPIFGVQAAAHPPTQAQIDAGRARQADIRANGDFMPGRFNQPQQFQSYASGLGLDPANINAGNFYSTFQGLRDQGLSPSRREFSRGAGQALPGLMDVRGDVGGHSLWKYLRGAGTGASATGYGDWLGQKDQPDQAKPLRAPRTSRGTTFAG